MIAAATGNSNILVLRGNHQQMMLQARAEAPPRRRRMRDENAWTLCEMNGGGWWDARKPGHQTGVWLILLRVLPFSARVETRHGPVELVHACALPGRWRDLEEGIHADGPHGHITRARVLWSRFRHGHIHREIGETGGEHLGPVDGVGCVATDHTPVPDPTWHENMLRIDSGVYIDDRGYDRLTIARIDGKEIETRSIAK